MPEAVPLTCTLQGAAALCAVSYDWLQRHWRGLVEAQGFPQPYLGSQPGERPRWLRASIVRWMEARSQGLTDFDFAQPDPPAPPAPDVRLGPPEAEPDEIVALLAAAGGR